MAFGGTAFPYLVLREHFVLSLPSHIANAPQPRQISIATLILAIIPERHTSAKKGDLWRFFTPPLQKYCWSRYV